jgi:hypothetical protein
MAELFGAPVGFLAAGEEQRANVTNTMAALKSMGEIAQQPADLALKQSHARYYSAEAAQKEAETADLQAMAKLEAEYNANAQGRNATVGDLGQGPPKSQAEQLMSFADFAEAKGAPLRVTGKIRKDASAILAQEATARWRGQESATSARRESIAKMQQVSNIASAAAESPQAFLQTIQDPEKAALLPLDKMDGDWAQHQRVLRTIAKAGQDSLARARLEEQQRTTELTKVRTQATVAASAAQADLARARRDEVVDRTQRVIKNGGEKSPEAAAVKQSQVEAQAAALEAKVRKEFPPAPLDPAARLPNTNYTAADGKTRFRWEKDPATGQMRARRLDVNVLPVKPSTAVPAVADDEEED